MIDNQSMRPQPALFPLPVTRRELLWNVTEPGDPYDIKRSMIAKMPGDRKTFMGSNIELVCLLQAAQIERLCQFLEDYKLRYRQTERSNLDRHSYQIQIKQLTQRLAEEESFRTENAKLVEFIKRQQAEIEYLQKISRDSNYSADGLKETYQRSLQTVNQLTNQNFELRSQLEKMRLELMNMRARYEALEKGKDKQIEQIKLNFDQVSKENYENRLASLNLKNENEIRKYEMEIKRLKDINDTKNSQINDLMIQREDLVRRLTANEGKADLQRQLYDYENKFVLFGQEIERLNIALRDYTNKLEESDLRRRELERAVERNQYERKQNESKLKSKDSELKQLREAIAQYEVQLKKVGTNQQFITQYEQQISFLQNGNTELTARLKTESETSRRYKEQIERLNYELSKSKLLQKQNLELRGSVQEIIVSRKKIVEYQNKIAIMSQQIDRLKSVISSRDLDLEKARKLYEQNENNKSKIRELETSIVSKYEFEISKIKAECQQKIEMITKNQGSVLGESQFYRNELEKTKEALRTKTADNEKQRVRINELETIMNRNQYEVSAKLRNYENNIAALKKDNEQFYNKMRALGDSDRKVYELQAKLSQYEREFARVTQNIKDKDEEILNLRNYLQQTQIGKKNSDSDYSIKIKGHQQAISSLRNENDEYRRKLGEAGQQLDRLGKTILKLKQEKTQIELAARQMTVENEDLRRKITELTQQSQSLRRQAVELRAVIVQHEGQSTSVTNSMEQLKTNASREIELLSKRLVEYEAILTEMSKQLDRLKALLKSRNQQYSRLNESYNALRLQNEEIRKRAVQLENKYKQFYQESSAELQKLRRELSHKDNNYSSVEGEYIKKLTVYENNVVNLTKINEELQKRIQDIDQYARQRNEDYLKLQNLLKSNSSDFEVTKRQWKETQQTLVQKYEAELSRRQNTYEQSLSQANNQIYQLRTRLQEIGGSTTVIRTEYEKLTQENQRLKSGSNLQKQEIEALRRKAESYESSFANFEVQTKHRFEIYEQNIKGLSQQNDDLRRRLNQAGDYKSKLGQYTSKIALLSQQMERLHSNLTGSTEQNQALKRQLVDKSSLTSKFEVQVRQKITIIQNQNNDLKRKMGDYEQRLVGMSQELDRIKITLKGKMEEISRLQQLKLNYEQNISQLRREGEQLSRRLKDSGEVNVKYSELERKYIASSQQAENLTQTLRGKQEEIIRLQEIYRNQANDIEIWKKKYSNLQENYTHTYEVEINKKLTAYETTIAELRNKLMDSMKEIERLNNILRLKVQQTVQYGNKLNLTVTELEQHRRRIKEIESITSQNFNSLKNQRDDLELRLRQSQQNLERKITEYQNRIRVTTQQMERLSEAIKSRTNQLEQTKREFKLYQESVTIEVKGNYTQYETKLSTTNKENQELRRKINQYATKVKEYESKLMLTSQQIDRLDSLVRGKSDDLVKANKQLEEMWRKWQESSETARKISQYEMKLEQLIKENEKLQLQIRGKNDQLTASNNKMRQYQAQIQTLRKQISEYEFQVNKKMSSYQQDLDGLARRKAQYESKIALLSQELERTNALLKTKSEQNIRLSQQFEALKLTRRTEYQEEFKILQQNYTVVIGEYDSAKRHLVEYEQSIRKLHVEFERLQAILQQLKTERDTLIEKNRAQGQQINKLTGKSRELEEQTRQYRSKLSDEAALQKHMGEQLTLMLKLFGEIETLRSRVREKQQEVVQVIKMSLSPRMI